MNEKQKTQEWIDILWNKIAVKFEKTAHKLMDRIHYTTEGGTYDDMSEKNIYWWTNGFYAGMLWMMYQWTKDKLYLNCARKIEDKLDMALHGFMGLHHDVGFLWLNTAVCDYTLTKNRQSLERGIAAASVLASRFNIAGNFIRAWNADEKAGWAIIDCLMNIPLLHWAARICNDRRFSMIACAHADTTLKYFIREDGSVRHIVEFDHITGEYIREHRGQGCAVGSSWSRGQSWAIYGFVKSYQDTKDVRYLNAAKKVANYFLTCMADDDEYLPKCDFRQPEFLKVIDSSAGAIAASGLIDLAYALEAEERKLYLNGAIRILKSLEEKCGLWDEENDALLDAAAGTFDSENTWNKPLIFGDFYFMEAVYKLKKRKIEEKDKDSQSA